MKSLIGSRRLILVFAVLLSFLRTAEAQLLPEKLEKELLTQWLVIIANNAWARVLTVREIAQRSDGSILLDATYGYTFGPRTPVRADIVDSGQRELILTIRTQYNSVIVAKQDATGSFKGTFTPTGRQTNEVTITRADPEMIERRVEEEILASKLGPGFAQENRDWGIAATNQIRGAQPHAPTPKEAPGAKTFTTIELVHALSRPNPPLLIDVLDGLHATIRGAHWMPGAGEAGRAPEIKLAAALEKLTGGDKKKPLVFFCLSSECWLSYNAALRALDSGYTSVGWYRGGTSAWRAVGFPTTKLSSSKSWEE